MHLCICASVCTSAAAPALALALAHVTHLNHPGPPLGLQGCRQRRVDAHSLPRNEGQALRARGVSPTSISVAVSAMMHVRLQSTLHVARPRLDACQHGACSQRPATLQGSQQDGGADSNEQACVHLKAIRAQHGKIYYAGTACRLTGIMLRYRCSPSGCLFRRPSSPARQA